MATVKHSSMTTLLIAVLVGVCACSDNTSTNDVKQIGDRRANDVLPPSTDANRGERAKTDAAFNDIALAAKVKGEILNDASLKTADIYVEAQDGTVLLSGTVSRKEDEDRAIQIAHSVGNVKFVESQLAVRSGG